MIDKKPTTRARRTTSTPAVGSRPAGRSNPNPPTESGAAARNRNIVGVVAVIAVIAAAACAVFFGIRAYDVYFEQKPVQTAREDSVAAAEQAMINVTTIDPKDLKTWNERIEASFTGEALKQVQQQVAARLQPMLDQAGSEVGVTTSRLVRSAPTKVNADEGTAGALVFLSVTGQRPNEAGVSQIMGFDVSMKKIGDQWKAEKVDALDSMQLDTPDEPQGGGN